MKKVFILSAAVLIAASVVAQSPEKMSYQAVIKDAANALVISHTVGMQISILQGSVTGLPVYIERHTQITNTNGLLSLEIGTGNVVNGDFASVDWSEGPYFLKTETDLTGGTDYAITGISQLLSVPYALHAKTAESLMEGITEMDPVYEASPAANITENDITDLSNLSGVNTGDQDLSNLTTKDALTDSIADLRSEIDEVRGLTGTKSVALSDIVSKDNAVNTQLKNLTDPTDAQDAATKAYVDALKKQILELQLETGIRAKDIDGNIYNTVTIGTQVWMSENLKVTRYNDGTPIPQITDNMDWSGLVSPGYCWYKNDKAAFGGVYGTLYNWYAIDAANVCPAGWHVAGDKDWMILTTFLGNEKEAGGKLKEAGTSHWESPNTGATDETGFTALPGGFRDFKGEFYNVGYFGYWWSSTQVGPAYAWSRYMSYNTNSVDKSPIDKKNGYSIRCVKD